MLPNNRIFKKMLKIEELQIKKEERNDGEVMKK